jgi:hypothetical protein
VSRGTTGRADETVTARRLGPRFGPEAGLILAAAVFAALLELSWPGVIVVVLCAWLAVAVFEIVRARVRRAAAEDRASPPPEPVAPPQARSESPAGQELEREPEPEPPRADRPPESPQPTAPSLIAAPERVEPAAPPEQERRS